MARFVAVLPRRFNAATVAQLGFEKGFMKQRVGR
jgi:hypothetical protein